MGQRPDLASLRAQVRAIERSGPATEAVPRFSLGLEALDAHLDGGLAMGRVHEIVGGGEREVAQAGTGEVRDGSAFGFAAALLVRLLTSEAVRPGGEVLWCCRTANMFGGAAFGWGLHGLGLEMDRVLFVDARDEADRLWAVEEGLRCKGLAAVVAELGPARTGPAGQVAERRLQLAAEGSGVTGFLLRSLGGNGAAGGAESRWHVASAPSPAPLLGAFQPSWALRLERLRGGQAADWPVIWDPEGGRFHHPEAAVAGAEIAAPERARTAGACSITEKHVAA